MKTKFTPFTLLLFLLLGVFSCKNTNQEEVKEIKPEPAPVVVYSSSKELVAAAKKEIEQISSEQLKSQLNNDEVYLIDIREKEEFDAGSISGANLIPRGLLEFRIASDNYWEDKEITKPAKDQKIIIYCRSGGRGSLATKTLQQMGYTNVVNLDGGFLDWKENYPTDISVAE